MRYESLIFKNNLELAWRRINTGTSPAYKRYFRQIYLAYEFGLEENLKHLHLSLKGGWLPTPPSREYTPKASGLQRPLSLMTIEDQIVYQSVANAFADKLKTRRSKVEDLVAYSNVLDPGDKSIFFVRGWRQSYRAFRNKVKEHYESGLIWIGFFDLSAFFDTISHELLIKMVSPRGGNAATWNKVREWLNCWSATPSSSPYHHGIPQGPLASGFLAECLLLSIDEQMRNAGIAYVRYVDDIRILADSELHLRRAIIQLEHSCRELGLIPHADKFAVQEAKSVDDAVGSLPSLAIEQSKKPWLEAQDAEDLLRSALVGKPQYIKDKSRVRFVMFRAEKSKKVLTYCLRLIPRHPEQIDAFVSYLSNYATSKRIENALADLLENGMPYDYVRGELWLVLSRIASSDCLKKMATAAKNDAFLSNSSVTLQWGAVSFLLRCEQIGHVRVSNRIPKCNPLVQSLLIPNLSEEHYKRDKLVSAILKDGPPEPGLAISHELVRRCLSVSDLGLRNRDLCACVQNCYKGVGIIGRRRNAGIDPIGQIITRRYGTAYSLRWRALLGDQYNHALMILNDAESAYDIARSQWIQHQNSFNDIVVRCIINHLSANGLPGAMKTVNRKGELIPFGNILDSRKPLFVAYPYVARPLKDLNDRRNKVPGSHPYSTKGGMQNKHLTRQEQRMHHSELSNGYGALIAILPHVL
jgi:retron-type reverse transcriptase